MELKGNCNIFNSLPDVLTVNDLQNVLHIGRTTAYKLIQNNEIEHIKVRKSIRIPKIFLQKYVEKAVEMCYNDSCSGRADMVLSERGLTK